MVLCQYFLKGSCRFGSNCKNEHSYYENPQSVLLKKPDIDINVLIKAASGDMLKSEKGNQWPLSCYGPFQGKPCFPGFEDKSFEEVRLGFYEAQKNGTLEQYKQNLNQALQDAQVKIKALQNPTAEAANMLKNIYSNTQSSFQGTNNSGFASNPPSYSNSVFGNAAPSNGQNVFASAAPNSFQQSNSVFSTANRSIFGGAASTPSAFGNTAPSQNQSIFGNQSSQTPQNVFANTANKPPSFGAATGQSIFGAAPPNQNIFASAANSPNLFTNTAPTQSIFGNPAPSNATQNVFASTASAFTSNSQNLTSAAPSQNIFTSAAPSQNVFASSANVFTSTPSQNVFTSAGSQNFTSAPSQNFAATTPGQNFGAATPGQTFATAAPNQNFGTATPGQTFATAALNQNFGTATPGQTFATAAPNQNFGNAAGGQGFGAAPPNVFASTANVFTNPAQNVFTSAAGTQSFTSTAPSQNIFTGASSIFGNAQQGSTPSASIFGSNTTTQAGFGSNNFNNPPSNSPFGASGGSSNIFQQANANLGGNSVFGAGQTHSANIFGNKSATVQPVARVDDPTIYTKVSDLSTEDVAQFESRCFEFGKIPIRPPPLEMC